MAAYETTTLQCPSGMGDSGCVLSNCVAKEGVIGLASNSASPVDTWILKFKKGVTYLGETINYGFLKWWINPKDLYWRKVKSADEDFEEYKNTISGLNYEVKIYRDVVRPLLDNDVCPNFVGFLASGTACSFPDLSSVLTPQGVEGMRRNVVYMRKELDSRPSVLSLDDPEDAGIITPRQELKWTYDFLLTTAVPRGSFTYEDWLYRDPDSEQKAGLALKQYRENTGKIVFQILAACYALAMTKTTHNDLHSGNTFIAEEPRKKVTYVYGGKVYSFDTEYRPLVFDFDRSYSVQLGDNPLLSDGEESNHLCVHYSQCNTYIPNADMVKVLCSLYAVREDFRRVVLNCLTPNPPKPGGLTRAGLSQILNGRCFFQEIGEDSSDSRFSLGEEKYKSLNSPKEILEKWAYYFDLEAPKDAVIDADGSVYVCDKSLFDEDGVLLPELVQKELRSILPREFSDTPL